MAIKQPPPPPLQADVENLVFSHKSLLGKPASTTDYSEDPQDWERMAFLGEGILLAAMSKVLYYAYPRRRTNALNPTRTGFLTKEELASITDSYRFMDRLKCLEPSRPAIARSLDNRASLAESFVGGLALQYGMDEAGKWAEQMLAWKHGLPIPLSDEERFGIGGGIMVNDGKEVVLKDVSSDSGSDGTTKGERPVAAMVVHPPTSAAPLRGVSPSLPTTHSIQPAHPITPRLEHVQIKPAKEVPNPIMEFQIPVQEPTYNPGTYQAGAVLPEVVTTAAGTATGPTIYNASSFYPISSSQPTAQPVPDTEPPSSPPAAASIPQLPEAVPQPQFQPSEGNIPV
ncbi:hypothetical protein M407DRAFT_17458 [Tulasnella calospora MUT 4182]|uniref:RNase III domain-containing protein n=1 Tax=Tulasnella calospora MUT 4182 TaxID=1051891 RepID=A0A0C3MJJ6_9AGAM|nr:hypothetical protein M407DRAFT_17458 [Tulasnella calospora MUT 4182]